MFSPKIDEFITMLQRLIALLRDVLLGIVILLTSIIIFFGGDPSKLNTLDWLKLVCLAFLIVIGPIATFFVSRTLIDLIDQFSDFTTSLNFDEAPIHKGWIAWVAIKVLRISKRKYLQYLIERRKGNREFIQRNPRIGIFLRDFWRLMRRLRYLQKWNAYLIALYALILFAVVFKEVLQNYTH
jgi:hypothetical protein